MYDLNKTVFTLLLFAAICLASPLTARADTVTFAVSLNGTLTTSGTLPVVGFLSSGTGTTSAFGNFSFTSSGIGGLIANPFSGLGLTGNFTFNFGGGNTLTGIVAQAVPFSTFPAPFFQTFTVTGGTGIFSGATGLLATQGLIDANGQFVTSCNGTVTGDGLVVTAVPEPATLLLLGTGLIGAATFQRRRRSARRRDSPTS